MEALKNILYIIPTSSFGEPELKMYHLLSRAKELNTFNIAVGFLYDNPLRVLLASLNINTLVLGGYSGATQYIQNNKIDIVHFYSSKRLLQVLVQNIPYYIQIVETVFDNDTKGDSTILADRSRIGFTIFDNPSLQALWPLSSNGIVCLHGLNPQVVLREDKNLLRSKYNIPRDTKVIGIICPLSDELSLNFLIQLGTYIKNNKSNFKIIICYNGLAKDLLASRIKTLELSASMYLDASSAIPMSLFDVHLDLSSQDQLRIHNLEALCYRVPLIVKKTEVNKALLAPRRAGLLYEKLIASDIYKYCIAAVNLDKQLISLPSDYHADKTIEAISGIYNKISLGTTSTMQTTQTTQTTQATTEVNDKMYIIIPYAIYGGAEVYLRNHISKGTFKNIHLLFIAGNNNLYNEVKDKVECTFLQGHTELGNYLMSSKVEKICFYNSANVYRLLVRVKKIHNMQIIEIIHSLHKWGDSMHAVDRLLIDKTIVVAATIAKQWGIAQYEVIPPVIDEDRFKIPKVAHPRIIIGTVARLSPEKNLKRVVDIAGYLDDNYKFVIVGRDGGSKSELQDYINQRNLGHRIIIKDHIDAIENEYATFDAFLLTSTVEGTPLTILEALAANLPVIAPNVGAIAEMLKDKLGYVFHPSKDDRTIASHIRALSSRKHPRLKSSSKPTSPPPPTTQVTECTKAELDLIASQSSIDPQPQALKKYDPNKKNLIMCQSEIMSLRALKQGSLLLTKYNVIGITEKLPSTYFGWGDDLFTELRSGDLDSIVNQIMRTMKIDYFYCHNPGEDRLLPLCALIKRNSPDTKIIYDINDCVSLNVKYAPVPHHAAYKNILIKHEQDMINASSAIVTPAKQLSDYIQTKRSDVAIYTFPNYFCDFNFNFSPREKLSKKDQKIHVAYLGGITFQGKTTVYYLIDIFIALLKNPNIIIHIYPSTSDNLDAYSCLDPKRVVVNRRTSPLAAVEAIACCDVGLCIFNPAIWSNHLCESSLPNKLFDYISAGLPILAHKSMPNIVEIVTNYNIGFVYEGKSLDFNNLSLEVINEKAANVKSASSYANMSTHINDLIDFIEKI